MKVSTRLPTFKVLDESVHKAPAPLYYFPDMKQA